MSSKFLVIRLSFEPETIVFHCDTREEAESLAKEKEVAENWDWRVYEVVQLEPEIPVNTE